MSRRVRVLLLSSASIAVAAFAAGCGTERISISKSDPMHAGAVLFSQRCSGCHTLAAAATHGSAADQRAALPINGPNFDLGCERPLTRVLYAIENGAFSGAYMPQNIVVGQDAIEVSQFVAKYAGRQQPRVPGQAVCSSKPIGTLPPAQTTSSTTSNAASAPPSQKAKPAAGGAGGKAAGKSKAGKGAGAGKAGKSKAGKGTGKGTGAKSKATSPRAPAGKANAKATATGGASAK